MPVRRGQASMRLGLWTLGNDAMLITRDVETCLGFLDDIAKILTGEVMWKGEPLCQTWT